MRRRRWGHGFDHGEWHGHPWWATRNPITRYVRARLHRRIFAWFGMTIIVTALVAGGVMNLLSPSGPHAWNEQVEHARTFVGGRFARVWDDSAERHELLHAMVQDLGLGVALVDAHGHVLEREGPDCGSRTFDVAINHGRTRLGTAHVCYERGPYAGLVPVLAVLTVIALLWAGSGRVARRLAWPLGELARVAHEIGAGKLSSRVRLGRHEPGEVGVLASAVNDMAVRIEKQIADQRELLAVVSHEMRTPLSRLRVLIELARSAGVEEKIAADMDREILEADDLVGQVLASSRLDFAALERRDLDAAQVAATALERAGIAADVLEVVEPGLRVYADATLLARALANLLDNGRHHGGGVLRLVVRRDGKQTTFEVQDSGPGFGPGEAATAFEPFRRGAQAQAQTQAQSERSRGSLGLGLSLVRRIALAHAGQTAAGNRAEGGAVVSMSLPTQP